MRRYSPSVADLSPIISCLRITPSISRSSMSVSSSALILPRARFSRASFSGAVRNRLPTWSARNGGLVRCMMVFPTFLLFSLLSPTRRGGEGRGGGGGGGGAGGGEACASIAAADPHPTLPLSGG